MRSEAFFRQMFAAKREGQRFVCRSLQCACEAGIGVYGTQNTSKTKKNRRLFRRKKNKIFMKIAMVQMDVAQGDFDKNLGKIASFAKKAKEGGAQIAVFPEMCVSGFNYKKNLEYLKTHGDAAEKRICQIAKNCDIAPSFLPYLGPSVLSWGFNLYFI